MNGKEADLTDQPEEITITSGSGNVFADLGFEDPEEMLLKAELVRRIFMELKRRKLTQVQAAEILGIDQPKVSALVRGRLTGFSVDRLLRFLIALGSDVDIIVKQRSDTDTRGRMRVIAA